MKGRSISRVTRTKAQARESYDRMSGWYDLLSGPAERKYKETGLRLLDVKTGEKVLEIGYGTGECILALARSAGSSGKVFGIDLSEGMHSIARSKIEKVGLKERVELLCGDAAALPFCEDSVDAIFCSFTLELFDTPEIPVVLRQCRRVLSPGGRICVVVMSKREKSSLVVKVYEWAHENLQRYADCRPIYARDSLEEAGFVIVSTSEMSMFGLPVDIILACIKM